MDQTHSGIRKFYFFVIIALAIVTGFTVKFYLSQKKENQALKLKIITLNKERKKPKAWGKLMAPAPVKGLPKETVAKKSNTIEQKVSTTAAAPLKEESKEEEDLANQTTEELVNRLNLRMGKIKTYNEKDIQKTIDIADELISREPDTYPPYKAKLIALLVEEGKFDVLISDNEVNRLLENMAGFDLTSDVVSRKEAALLANADQQITLLATQLEQLTNDRAQVEAQLESFRITDPTYKVLETQIVEMSEFNPAYKVPETKIEHLSDNLLETLRTRDPAYQALEARRADLAYREEETLSKLSDIQTEIDTGVFPGEEIVNEDVVQIPFFRMMAKGEYSQVLENAENFIQQFPSSPTGYFFLALALDQFDRRDEALEIISKSPLSEEAQNQVIAKINLARGEDPKRYWEKLNF